jgi:hypothetical protein
VNTTAATTAAAHAAMSAAATMPHAMRTAWANRRRQVRRERATPPVHLVEHCEVARQQRVVEADVRCHHVPRGGGVAAAVLLKPVEQAAEREPVAPCGVRE